MIADVIDGKWIAELEAEVREIRRLAEKGRLRERIDREGLMDKLPWYAKN
jgi:hypothetical protein